MKLAVLAKSGHICITVSIQVWLWNSWPTGTSYTHFLQSQKEHDNVLQNNKQMAVISQARIQLLVVISFQKHGINLVYLSP